MHMSKMIIFFTLLFPAPLYCSQGASCSAPEAAVSADDQLLQAAGQQNFPETAAAIEQWQPAAAGASTK